MWLYLTEWKFISTSAFWNDFWSFVQGIILVCKCGYCYVLLKRLHCCKLVFFYYFITLCVLLSLVWEDEKNIKKTDWISILYDNSLGWILKFSLSRVLDELMVNWIFSRNLIFFKRRYFIKWIYLNLLFYQH